MGKELYNKKAGLLAAFLYGIYPVAASQATTMGDDVPMAFFATAAFYLMLMGRKRRPWLLLWSGFVSAIAFLITPETIIVAFPIMVILFFNLARGRSKKRALQHRQVRSWSGNRRLAIMAIGYVSSAVRSTSWQVAPDFTNWCSGGNAYLNTAGIANTYFNSLFPNGLTHKFAATFDSSNHTPISTLAVGAVNPKHGVEDNKYEFGFSTTSWC